MEHTNKDMGTKKDIRLSETTERVVRSSRDDDRVWLADAPVCTALALHGIVHVGIAEATHPYQVRRPDLSGTFVMAGITGEGQVWIEGAWCDLPPGMACLAPQHSFHAYRSVPGKTWCFVWVRYQEPGGTLPFVNARAPVVAAFRGGPLHAAVDGLHGEATGTASPAAMQLWADLIQHYARTFAEPWRADDRLRAVWQQVSADLTADWSLARLAALAGLGVKQFGRLCQQSLGRTPSQHVTWLRLQRASSLLTITDEKVESIARSVGYASLFTFSHTFKRFTGCRPSEYRRRGGH